MLNPDIKKEWIDNLMSDKWKQGKGRLCNEDYNDETGEYKKSYCCLGVLCELNGNSGIDMDNGFPIEADPGDGVPLEYLGLSPNVQQFLANLNDDGEFTFKDIARIIKHHPEI